MMMVDIDRRRAMVAPERARSEAVDYVAQSGRVTRETPHERQRTTGTSGPRSREATRETPLFLGVALGERERLSTNSQPSN